MDIRADVTGAVPEQVLVIEIVGSVENFVRAVGRIPGLDWLAEIEDQFEPDEDFYDPEAADEKPLSGELFLVMSNQEALNEMLSLWRIWETDQSAKLPYGLAPWKGVFRHLKTIRPWDARDRLGSTGVLADWEERLAVGQETLRAEIELWYRSDQVARLAASERVSSLVEQQGGRVTTRSEIGEIAYHALLAELPREAVERILATQDAAVVRADEVMFFRPVGQAVSPHPVDSGEDPPEAPNIDEEQPEPTGEAPIVAIFDGLPIENHALLAGRLVVDDPDDWGSTYPVETRVHGTAMCSLAIHGDLADGANAPVPRRVYLRPIMRPVAAHDGTLREAVPDDVLFVDLVNTAVRRLFEMDGDDPPSAPEVRVINLSVCDAALVYVRSMSPLARLLDWLSWHYGVLFVVSAGNHPERLTLRRSVAVVDSLPDHALEQLALEALADEMHLRRLLSPAESINAITVGAAHADASPPTAAPHHRDLIQSRDLPSPINALGLGFRRSIKPEILVDGGRQLYRDVGLDGSTTTVEPAWSILAPGNLAASPGRHGDLTAQRHSRGTSNAAAQASHAAHRIFDEVIAGLNSTGRTVGREHQVALMKALLAHGANWGDGSNRLESVLRARSGPYLLRDFTGRFLGYGRTDFTRVVACTDQRATMIGFGQLAAEDADEYLIPLPASLSGEATWRRLTVTLAWMSPINPKHRAYRRAQLWFSPPQDELTLERVGAQWQAVQRGTVQHEVLEGDRAAVFSTGAELTLMVSCRADAGALEERVPYGLAVTLEVAAQIQLPIYQEIATRLRPAVQVRPGT